MSDNPSETETDQADQTGEVETELSQDLSLADITSSASGQ